MRALPHWYLHFIQLSFDSDYRITSAAPLLGEQIKRQNVDKYCVKKWQILASLKNFSGHCWPPPPPASSKNERARFLNARPLPQVNVASKCCARDKMNSKTIERTTWSRKVCICSILFPICNILHMHNKVLCQGDNEFKDNCRNCSVRVSLHLFNYFPNL